MVDMAESSTSIDCLGCGTVTRVKQRRLVTEHVRIVSLWTAILLSCINIDEAVAKGVVGTHIYMCKKCFGAYERFLSDFDKLNVSMLQAATVLKLVPDPDSLTVLTLHTSLMSQPPVMGWTCRRLAHGTSQKLLPAGNDACALTLN